MRPRDLGRSNWFGVGEGLRVDGWPSATVTCGCGRTIQTDTHHTRKRCEWCTRPAVPELSGAFDVAVGMRPYLDLQW